MRVHKIYREGGGGGGYISTNTRRHHVRGCLDLNSASWVATVCTLLIKALVCVEVSNPTWEGYGIMYMYMCI